MRARSLTALSNAWFGWGGGSLGAQAASAAAANRSASSAVGRKEVTTRHCSHDSARRVNLLFACEFRHERRYGAAMNDGRARWLMLALLFITRVSLGLQFQTMGSVADPVVHELGLSF